MREKIPLLVAIVFGVIALWGINSYIKSQETEITKVEVIIAKEQIPAGTILEGGHLATKSIDQLSFIPEMYQVTATSPKDRLEGWQTATLITKGNVILNSQIQVEDIILNDLAPLIDIGFRAISIPLDEVSAVSLLVKPGDHVDILINYEIPYIRETEVEVPNTGKFKIGQKETEPATIYLLQDVIVLACDRTIITDKKYSDPSGRGYRAVTIAVTPKEARTLAFANKNADQGYTLTMRNSTDAGILEDWEVASYKSVLEQAKLEELLRVRKDHMATIYEGGVERIDRD